MKSQIALLLILALILSLCSGLQVRKHTQDQLLSENAEYDEELEKGEVEEGNPEEDSLEDIAHMTQSHLREMVHHTPAYGGRGGSCFRDFNVNADITRVTVYSGQWIDSVHF